MEDFVTGNLKITIAKETAGVAVTWSGESDGRAVGDALTPFLGRLADVCDGTVVTMDFLELAYMNSATVTPVVQFLKVLAKKANRVTVRYKKDLAWQVASFRAIRVVARNWKNTEIVGA